MATKRTITVRICKHCGKAFATKTRRNYCSKECAAVQRPANTKDTLCWDCGKATGKGDCPWANKFQPVDGWKAKPTTIKMRSHPDGEIQSYKVIECPLYKIE